LVPTSRVRVGDIFPGSLSLSLDRENVEDKTFFLRHSSLIRRPYRRFALSDGLIDVKEVNQRLVDEGMISGMSTNPH
jgi:hypothetical protein